MIHFIHYVRNRLAERSTYIAIAAAISAAAALAMPYSALFIGLSALAALCPDGSVKKPDTTE